MPAKLKKPNELCLVFVLALASLPFLQSVQAQTTKRPNILFIAIDDMNNYVGCMGGPAQTPNIDALAKKGMLFNNAYCGAPACNPSRVAMLTGMRPESTGQYTNQGNFREIGENKSLLTLPQKLMNAGYETVAAGKIFHHPVGTDANPNPLSDPVSWNFQVPGRTGTIVPNEIYKTKAGAAKWLADDTLAYANGKALDYLAGASIWGPNFQPKERTGDWQMGEACIDYLKKKHDKPFFFALGFSKPHQPLIAPKEFFDLYPLDKIGMPDFKPDDMDDIPEINKKNFSSPFVEKIRRQQQIQLAYQAYLACISFTDACIGNVLNALAKSEYANNTIVVLFTDHGFQLGTKDRWEKYSLWKLRTNSPLVIYAPGNTNAGKVCKEAVSLMDVHPTLLELAGLQPGTQMQAVSLTAQLNDPHSDRKFPAIVTHEEGNNSIVWKQYNYIRYKDGSEELYDHNKDNNEYVNLAGDKAYLSVINRLRAYIPEVIIPQNNRQKKTMGTIE